MSTKATATTKKEKEKPALVPSLRFPEFRGAREWTKSLLIGLGNEPLSNGVFNDPKRVGAGYKLINVSDMYIDTTIDEDRLSLLELRTSDFEANKVIDGDIFFTRSSLVPSGIAASNIYLGKSCDVTFDGHLIRFRPNKSKVAPLFAHYLFKTAPIRSQLIARGKSATMTTIGQADVASVTLSYPEKNEQQAIADCLSSVDELMAAQARKVDALKTHKKGLMQQLFPREGETKPRLRFPEFQGAGEWEESTVEEVIAGITPPKKLQTADYQPEGEFPIVDQSKDQICGWTNDSYAVIAEKLPVIVFGDHTCALKFIDHPFVQGADGIKIFRPKRGIDARFLFFALEANPVVQETYKRHFSTLKEKQLLFPDPQSGEQQRIAECLSSLNVLITAEMQNLEALKTHKKGLMQQLFPSPEEN
jgi:type I restriction enzyme S subunit